MALSQCARPRGRVSCLKNGLNLGRKLTATCYRLRQCEACYQELTKIKGVDILRGKINLEVRSLLVNKGEVVKRIQQQVNPDFILCAGDDRTDEDMFRALRHQRAYCVSIGPQDKETLAQWHIDTPEEFVACLGTLVALKPTSTL